MNNDPLGPKDPEEIKVMKFPFARELNGGTIASVTSVTVATHTGTDATPSAVLLGAAVVSGTDVLQRVQAGVDGVTYKLRAKVVDNAGNVHVVADTLRVATL